jgi:hypothetical protein
MRVEVGRVTCFEVWTFQTSGYFFSSFRADFSFHFKIKFIAYEDQEDNRIVVSVGIRCGDVFDLNNIAINPSQLA